MSCKFSLDISLIQSSEIPVKGKGPIFLDSSSAVFTPVGEGEGGNVKPGAYGGGGDDWKR